MKSCQSINLYFKIEFFQVNNIKQSMYEFTSLMSLRIKKKCFPFQEQFPSNLYTVTGRTKVNLNIV